MTPFDAYKTYLALKNHFSKPNYDYFKYAGKSRTSIASFEKRKDKYWFEKISRNKDDKEILFSSIDKKNTWEPNNPNGKTSYTDKEKYNFVSNKGSGTTSRCDWIKCCGSNSNTKGVWQGVQNTCSYDPNIVSM